MIYYFLLVDGTKGCVNANDIREALDIIAETYPDCDVIDIMREEEAQ